MKMKKSLIALLILISLVLGLSGCILDGDDAETTAPPTTTAAPTTTAPPTTMPPFTSIKEIGTSDSMKSFTVTIQRVGFFTHSKYGTAGPEVTHFRVDLKIENTMNGTNTIYPNINCYIVDDTNYKWPIYFIGSPTDLSGDYGPLEEREGYLVFEEINEDSETFTFTIEIPTANLPVKIQIPFEYP